MDSTSLQRSSGEPPLDKRPGHIRDTVMLAQKVKFALCSRDGIDKSNICSLLASSLRHHSLYGKENSILECIIDLECEALTLRSAGYPAHCTPFDGKLAASLWMRYKRDGDIRLLDEVIYLERSALDLCPKSHPGRWSSCDNLAVSLSVRYRCTDDVLFLDGVINLERECLDLRPEGHPDRALSCERLAASLSTRHQRTGDDINLVESIELRRAVLALHPKGHPSRGSSCEYLAGQLGKRYQRTGDVLLLNEATDLQREAVAGRLKADPYFVPSCGLLASLLSTRYERTGDVHFLHECIEVLRGVLFLCPEGRPLHASSCAGLAASLSKLYDCSGNACFLDESIGLQREALSLRLEAHPDHALCCENLAALLSKDYQRTGDANLLEEAIDLLRTALILRPDGDPGRASSSKSLAASLSMHYQRTGDMLILKEAITLGRVSLALCPEGHPGRASSCQILAASLSMFHQRTGNISFIDEAIKLGRESLALCFEEHPDRALSCGSLAASLGMRYQRTGDDSNLDESICLHRAVLALHPKGHPNRGSSCGNLAVSLVERYNRTGDVLLLYEATDLQREAVALCHKAHPDYAWSSALLAAFLSIRYEHTGDNHLLEESIRLEREVVTFRPQGHPDRALSCGNLASALCKSYERTGEVHILDEAIAFQRQVVSICSEGHPDRALACGNLANSLSTRYIRTADDHLLNESIDLLRQALALCPVERPDYVIWCGNLAALLNIHYERTGNYHLLPHEAIDLGRKSLTLRPQGHPDRALSCGNLAGTLSKGYERTGEVHLLDEAITLQREVLDILPHEHPNRALSCGNLAILLRMRYMVSGENTLLHSIFSLAHECLLAAPVHAAWKHLWTLCWLHLQQASDSFYDVRLAISYVLKSVENEPGDPITAVFSILACLDDLWHHQTEKKHLLLTTTYNHLVRFLPLLANPALETLPQLRLLKDCSKLGSDAFVNAALAGSPCLGFENLELAQGVIWSQSLYRRDPQLDDVPKLLAMKLNDCLTMITTSAGELHDGARTTLASRDTLHARSSQAYALLREIRALPGLDRFMLGETYETLCGAASNHPIIVLVGARKHFYALVITSSQHSEHSLLSLDLTDEDLTYISFNADLKRSHRAALTPESTRSEVGRGMKKTIPRRTGWDGQLETLWRKVVKPVLDHLGLKPSCGRDRPRLHWCPTGILSATPLHAAGIYDGPSAHRVCCADFVVSSYTPTVTSLLHAQKAATPLVRQELSMTLVAEKQAPKLPIIALVDEEIKDIAAVAKSSNVKIIHQHAGSTTVLDTAAAMQAANIVHLACHGIQDSRDATQSGFCLGDGRLTISKLMELKLDGAFLAFLSACETAKGDKEQPDQVMHLAAAMLFSGFKSLVATMWSIRDDDGPKVARWFYEELFANEVADTDSVAHALDVAVNKLRASGVPPHHWAPFIHMGA